MEPRVTVAFVVSAYLRHCERLVKADAFSAAHLVTIRLRLRQFEQFVGPDKLVIDCKQYDLSAWLEENQTWKSTHTRKYACTAVTACFHFAEEEELIDRCPYRSPRALRGAITKPRRPATHEEYLSLFRAASRPIMNALFFLRETGCRTCEMRELRWTDITFGENSYATLHTHKTFRKTGRLRIIAFNSVVARFLLWVKARSSSEYCFVNGDGEVWNRFTFNQSLQRVAKRAGLTAVNGERVTGYCLRHTYTVEALIGGATTKAVADQLGHVDTKMVERVYGSHTRNDIGYMTRIADEIRKRRNGKPGN